MNFNVNDIIVDFYSTFGKDFVLVDVVPKPVYRNNEKTDEVILSHDDEIKMGNTILRFAII